MQSPSPPWGPEGSTVLRRKRPKFTGKVARRSVDARQDCRRFWTALTLGETTRLSVPHRRYKRLQLDQFDERSVRFPDHLRFPVVGKQRQFVGEVNFLHPATSELCSGTWEPGRLREVTPTAVADVGDVPRRCPVGRSRCEVTRSAIFGLFGDLALIFVNQSSEHRQMTETLEIVGKKQRTTGFRRWFFECRGEDLNLHALASART